MSDSSFVKVCRESASRHQRVLVVLTTGLAFLCTVLGMALPYWVYTESTRSIPLLSGGEGSTTTTTNTGLWQECSTVSCYNLPEEQQKTYKCGPGECKKITFGPRSGDVPAWLTASRLFMTLGLIGSLLLVLLGALFVCNEQHRENQKFKKAFYIFALLAGISVIEAVMMFGVGANDAILRDPDSELHAAFGLSCIAIFANLAVGILVWLLVKPGE